MAELLTDDQIDLALRDLIPHWKAVDKTLVRTVERDTFLDGIRLVATVAQLAEATNHHPDIDIRYTKITFRVTSHDAGGITEDDLVLAHHIDTAAE
ncbi:4a-hydroxytetrahydrobiopterin dehydratase [Kribbella sp. NPDC051587]|jgi:4a-hydroxytetrahydrobiopterin dehydratase|uniref:Putative pterin-4-alpha-carbinolamine dehydratase n=1 Tax=Kribbella antibiotica TaxID=190195 RepID=A0A4R4Z913_9ACTN|nr:4a-hydroxytetrahydrobiopterin dehydratase [Kribbella antibiotica]TDD54675.1 4a-hydroxytetrahydrobiopterin dehydratase [Kribbella antibiotica]